MADIGLILLGLAIIGVLGWVIFADPTRAQAAKQKKDIEDEVNHLGPADLDSRFDKWVRDKDRPR